MRKRSFLFSGLLLLLLSLTVSATVAQELCETLVRDAWKTVLENCDGMDPLNACYGFDSLDATFNQNVSRDAFSEPSDIIQIPELHTVHTLPFDAEVEEWGVTNFRIDAESFGGEPGESIIIFTTGDTIVENAVEAGSDLEPMQAFNFKTGGQSDCKEAPNAVFIQAPKGLSVDLLVNSTPIRIGSTVVLGIEATDTGHDLMYFTVIEGSLTLYPDTTDEQVVPEGAFTAALLSDEAGQDLDGKSIVDEQFMSTVDTQTGDPVLGVDGEPFYRQVPVTGFTDAEELTTGTDDFTDWSYYTFVLYIPPSLLNYPLISADEPILRELASEVPAEVLSEAASLNPGDSFDLNSFDSEALSTPSSDSFSSSEAPPDEASTDGQQQQNSELPIFEPTTDPNA